MHTTTGEHMTEEDEEFQRLEREAKMRALEDDDTQVYKKPWVGLTGQEQALIASVSLDVHDAVHRTNTKLKEKNT
jgi:hypothetical protein